jgi:hypothetical protein
MKGHSILVALHWIVWIIYEISEKNEKVEKIIDVVTTGDYIDDRST